jgi:hypothetical protein
MEIRTREMHYRWIDTPSEPVFADEVPNPEPPPHPDPNDPPPTAREPNRPTASPAASQVASSP